MSKKINLETILDQFDKHKCISEAQKSDILPAMMEACRQTLELASETAKIESVFDDNGELNNISDSVYKPHPYNKRLDEHIHINKKSILDTIKQIKMYEIN